MNESLRFKMTLNSGLKFIKFKIGVLLSKNMKKHKRYCQKNM